MLFRFKKKSDIPSSEITPYRVYQQRREFLKTAAFAGAIAATAPSLLLPRSAQASAFGPNLTRGKFATDEEPTPYDAVTSYNNFYELGTGKDDPAENADKLITRPWTVTVDGEVHNPKQYDINDILKRFPMEERIYRLRCVEAWSMVVPWIGFELGALLKEVEPTGKAKYVAFETLFDPERMPGQTRNVLQWPYREGLRLDEAMHPLTILSVGLYDKMLPGQNGAPIRLVAPWKYGFKSIKSIVRITLTETMPQTSWNMANAGEYGFYSNVNPTVDHPRWSQSKERRIGDFLKRETLMFNGYDDEVSQLYAGMDLKKNY